MRIIAGKAKGKKLYSPKAKGIRPTADRVKESVFNVLGECWHGIKVLDLFSGTGSLGLEAISRGAEQVVFVEKSRSALNVLRKNIALCGFGSHAVVMAMSVSRSLSLIGRKGESFQVIFADPPYGRGWVDKTVQEILGQGILSEGGMVVIEHAPSESPSTGNGRMAVLKRKKYGDTAISFLGFSDAQLL
ncbi:MAG: 16S rRNA (guanine(966)-N(2))-methyltransferase RsmD [Proteobacteria bacterium]|nr:16S rRNA (guanine(966)-N(2))-methyltransferase RsmD [Pseudomonadota bacterium]